MLESVPVHPYVDGQPGRPLANPMEEQELPGLDFVLLVLFQPAAFDEAGRRFLDLGHTGQVHAGRVKGLTHTSGFGGSGYGKVGSGGLARDAMNCCRGCVTEFREDSTATGNFRTPAKTTEEQNRKVIPVILIIT